MFVFRILSRLTKVVPIETVLPKGLGLGNWQVRLQARVMIFQKIIDAVLVFDHIGLAFSMFIYLL